MNITLFQAIAGGISLILASVGGAWVTGSASANREIAQTRFDATTFVAQERLERTTTDTELQGKFDTVDKKLDAIIDGLGIKYSLPKTKTYTNPDDDRPAVAEPKAELDPKIPLIKGTLPNGAPRQ